jgi:hypothetical protein
MAAAATLLWGAASIGVAVRYFRPPDPSNHHPARTGVPNCLATDLDLFVRNW